MTTFRARRRRRVARARRWRAPRGLPASTLRRRESQRRAPCSRSDARGTRSQRPRRPGCGRTTGATTVGRRCTRCGSRRRHRRSPCRRPGRSAASRDCWLRSLARERRRAHTPSPRGTWSSHSSARCSSRPVAWCRRCGRRAPSTRWRRSTRRQWPACTPRATQPQPRARRERGSRGGRSEETRSRGDPLAKLASQCMGHGTNCARRHPLRLPREPCYVVAHGHAHHHRLHQLRRL